MVGYTKAAFIVDAKTVLKWTVEKASSMYELYGEKYCANLIKERMKEKKEMFPLIKDVHEYTDYLEMIEKEKPELVAIATESGKHAKIALDCIRHGINVIIEKPIALSMHDAKEIVEEAEKHHVKVCANHQNRFNKAVQKMYSAILDNKFGKLWF